MTKKKKRWLILLLLLLIATAGGSYWYFKPKEQVQVISGDYLPDSKNAHQISDEELKTLEQKAVDSSKFNMVIKPDVVFENSAAAGSLYIKNPLENAYPINVTIALDGDSQQVVYSSGAIEPGYEITEGRLETELDAGEYAATATFHIYDPKTKEKRGQVQAALVLSVLS